MIRYYVFDPAGNITALADTAVKVEDQPAVAREIMKIEQNVEQVGFVRVCGRNGKPEGHLRMAGGEFCGNASMCTAVLKRIKEEKRGKVNAYPDGVKVTVSGTRGPVTVKICETETKHVYRAEGQMPWPRRFGEISINGFSLPYVDCGGISHVIFAGEPEKEEAEELIREACDKMRLKALGFVYLGEMMKPLVYVREADTLYWERSCASGTAAVGAWLAAESGTGMTETGFAEPGGTVQVFADAARKELRLSTEIRLIKEAVL